MSDNSVLLACQQGIEAWKTAFNHQDAEGCAAQYQVNCTMEAQPFGVFEGREAIQAFWQNIIDQGFSDVSYTDVQWTKVGEDGYLLTSSWTMNKAFGVVHKEHWVIESDGVARLASDHFEVQGER
ncbi:nuclear transport factor 2 family protein [uncultured Vibrio sp.]|uniref:YybH family protein n=1 Tax=uncultured Vibrio sp. TaxID=114054 RepID=UPI0025E445D7|nr:nuclear transport factor 2 family protein [uncultured Vibrio sp.]